MIAEKLNAHPKLKSNQSQQDVYYKHRKRENSFNDRVFMHVGLKRNFVHDVQNMQERRVVSGTQWVFFFCATNKIPVTSYSLEFRVETNLIWTS